jgi:hypothetical protein
VPLRAGHDRLRRRLICVTFYGIADSRLVGSELGEVIELYVRREDAEQALEDVLTDEPSWASELRVIPVELG